MATTRRVKVMAGTLIEDHPICTGKYQESLAYRFKNRARKSGFRC